MKKIKKRCPYEKGNKITDHIIIEKTKNEIRYKCLLCNLEWGEMVGELRNEILKFI